MEAIRKPKAPQVLHCTFLTLATAIFASKKRLVQASQKKDKADAMRKSPRCEARIIRRIVATLTSVNAPDNPY
jgi:hypothetical protein